MEKLLSIVIPVYNVEKYIVKCLSSLVVPNDELFRLLEVIVVNDGTPDNSSVMAKAFEEKHPEVFRVIDKENGGHGSAFNRGIREATGKYIRFLDSDDWFDTTNLIKLLQILKASNADLIFTPFTYYYVEDNRYERFPIKNIEFGKLYDMNAFDFVHSGNRDNLFIFHNCTYKTEGFKRNLPVFAEHVFYDDVVLRVAVPILAENFIAYDFTVYYYLVGRKGQTITYENNIKHFADHTKVLGSIVRIVKNNPLSQGERYNAVRYHFSTMAYKRIEDSSRLKYHDARKNLAEVREVLDPAEGLYDERVRYRMYKLLPFPVFYYLFKAYDNIFYRHQIR